MKEAYQSPLWQRIGGKTGPYDLGPTEIANILLLLADEVEHRGSRDYDRDPGETADWLRNEAATSCAWVTGRLVGKRSCKQLLTRLLMADKEQALEVLDNVDAQLGAVHYNILRRAIEALPDDPA